MVKITTLSIGSHGAFVMVPIVESLRKDGANIDLYCEDSSTLDEDIALIPKFFERVSNSDILFINVHGDVTYFRHFDKLKKILDSSNVSVLLYGCDEDILTEYRRYFRGSDEEYSMLLTLKSIGGDENQRSALLWCLNRFDGTRYVIPEPNRPMTQGVYTPEKGAFSLDIGIENALKTGKPVIAIFFVNVFYTRHNLESIDALYRAVKSVGAEPLPIFYCTYEDTRTGSIGIRRIIDEYLIRNGRSVIDVVLNTNGFSMTLLADPGCGEQRSKDNFLARLGVPVIQAIAMTGSRKTWEENPFGLSPAEIAYSVVSPEFDGQIDAPPFSGTEKTETGDYVQIPLEERCHALAEMAYRWACLRHRPTSMKKIAVLVYMYPPRQDLACGGYGLDTPLSVTELLFRLKEEGYTIDWLPADGKELMNRLLEGVTNDDNWISDSQIRKRSVATITEKQYSEWYNQLSEKVRSTMVRGWGEPPGDLHMLGKEQLVPGIMNGNIFIGFQPDRGKAGPGSYHDPWLAPPHQYLGFYRWLKDIWGADAIIHVGTHGTLEWLPGKSVALSGDCFPDLILNRMPNINPYIIDNPGEGMQSKRRQYAVTTTHMIPAMGRAGGYGEIDTLVSLIQRFIRTKDSKNDTKLDFELEKILEVCKNIDILSDLGLSEDCSIKEMEENVDRLYDYLLEIKEAMIKDGLHILGKVPEGKRLTEMIYSLIRYRNGDIPSLREAIAHSMELDLNELLRTPSSTQSDGRINGELIESIDAGTFEIIDYAIDHGFNNEMVQKEAKEKFPNAKNDMFQVLDFMCGPLINAVKKMPEEIGNILSALNGCYIEPGPSGCPGRGRAQILPTGRNFYSIDPDGIPWQSSWKIGSEMAERMVERYVLENGVYPNSVGVVLWATDTMKTGGDDVAYVLKLMGLRPVWSTLDDRVKELEVIPLSELKRPRIDVTVRISGLFRDSFPNISNMLDEGVWIISELDEDDEVNYLAANIRRETVEALANGVPVDQARRDASIRIFGDAPGQYGNGVSDVIFTGEWKTVDDLAEVFVDHGCYVYGKGLCGEARQDLFRRRLSVMNVTVKNHNTRAVDMMDMDDDLDSLGGFTAAVTSLSGQRPTTYMGDSSDTSNLKLRTDAEECRFIFRSKIDNPKWLEGLKKHGFAGAKELSKLFDYTMGWSATSNIVENWMYDDLADRFILDEDTKEWIKDDNPYAMMAMLARLQEAEDRGFWNPTDEVREKLKDIYLDFEERIEEITDR